MILIRKAIFNLKQELNMNFQAISWVRVVNISEAIVALDVSV